MGEMEHGAEVSFITSQILTSGSEQVCALLVRQYTLSQTISQESICPSILLMNVEKLKRGGGERTVHHPVTFRLNQMWHTLFFWTTLMWAAVVTQSLFSYSTLHIEKVLRYMKTACGRITLELPHLDGRTTTFFF